MKIAGICEYNPFHNGHAYHIAETKENCDAVICVMSGDFVQRGEAALCSKHLRAKATILCGADLVIELPVPYSCASAERFAKGGVHLLSSLGVADILSFGAECDDMNLLKKASHILNEPFFFERVSEKLKGGISFAKARELSLCEYDPALGDVISKPNNLLAIEYLRFLPKDIEPFCVNRIGVNHDDNVSKGELASASLIRECITKGEDVSPYVPSASIETFYGLAPVLLDDKIVLSYLKRLSLEDFKNVPDVTEGLEARIFKAVKEANTLEELYSAIKTKRYALSRIRRIILNAYLGITKDEVSATPAFARVLAMNDNGKKILAKARKVSTIPIITKPAQGKGIPAFEKSVMCSDLYALFSENNEISEWKRSPFILGE